MGVYHDLRLLPSRKSLGVDVVRVNAATVGFSNFCQLLQAPIQHHHRDPNQQVVVGVTDL